jgi:superfamily II DNA or RNA helicase
MYSASELDRISLRLEVNLKTSQNRAQRSPGHFARTRLSAVQCVAREALDGVSIEIKNPAPSVGRIQDVLSLTEEIMAAEPSLDAANYEGNYKFYSRRDSLIDEIYFEAKVERHAQSATLSQYLDRVIEAALPGSKDDGSKPSDAPESGAFDEISELDLFEHSPEPDSPSDVTEENEYGLIAPPLRRWQEDALTRWEANAQRGVVEAVTGTGKSMVGLAAIASVVRQGGNALVVVPTSALLEQWVRDLSRRLPSVSVGKLTGGKNDDFTRHDVIIATVQSASKHQPKPGSLALLIGDEVHRYGAKSFSNALNPIYSWRLGLTATYERQGDDGVEEYLEPYFGRVIFEYGYGQALEEKVVAPFELATIGVEFTPLEREKYDEAEERCWKTKLKLVKEYFYPEDWPKFFEKVQAVSKRNSYDQESILCGRYIKAFTDKRTVLAEAQAKEDFTFDVRDAFGLTSRSLIFTETKASASRIAHGVNQAVVARPITSDLKGPEREDLLKKFGNGSIRVLCAPRLLDEGIDVPEADFAMIVAASKSKRQMIQRMGRVIRLKGDGRHAKIALVYVKQTSEDPDDGGHEAFLGEVMPYASSVARFQANNIDAFKMWLGS